MKIQKTSLALAAAATLFHSVGALALDPPYPPAQYDPALDPYVNNASYHTIHDSIHGTTAVYIVYTLIVVGGIATTGAGVGGGATAIAISLGAPSAMAVGVGIGAGAGVTLVGGLIASSSGGRHREEIVQSLREDAAALVADPETRATPLLQSMIANLRENIAAQKNGAALNAAITDLAIAEALVIAE